MAWGSEERGFQGSEYFVRHPTKAIPLDNVVYYLNFDMVGSYTVFGEKILALGSVSTTPALAELEPLVGPAGLNVTRNIPGIGDSDSDYWSFCSRKIPIVGFYTHDTPCWHESCDTVDRIDFPNMSKIVKLGHDLTRRLGDTAQDLAAFRETATTSQIRCSGYPDPADE